MKMYRSVSLSIRVGYLEKSIIDLINVELNPGEIKHLPGGIKHIKKKRPDCEKEYVLPEISV